MLNITQNSTSTWVFYEVNALPNFLFEATEKCSGVVKLFNATNLATSGCGFLEFLIEEVTAGVEDLDDGKVKFIAGQWEVKLYQQASATNKDPSLATFLKEQYLVVYSDGTVIPTPPVPTPGFCASANVSNSDDTYDVNVASGASLELPDITHTDSDGSPVVKPAQTPFVATQKSDIRYHRPSLTGETIDYGARSDGWRQQNGGYDFSSDPSSPASFAMLDPANRLLLLTNNSFGNKNRFTNDVGGSVYDGTGGSTVNYTIDHYTGYGWEIVLKAAPWTTALADNTFGGYTDMFVPNINEIELLITYAGTWFNYAPFNFSLNSQIWTSTTLDSGATNAYYEVNINKNTVQAAKTIGFSYFRTRKHF